MFSMESGVLSDALRGGKAPKREEENKKLISKIIYIDMAIRA